MSDLETERVTMDKYDQIREWWRVEADREITRTVPKMVEYGSTDLVDIGAMVNKITGRTDRGDEFNTEIGIFFYVWGKMARWASAIERGELVSDDTLFDIGVYTRMLQLDRYQRRGGKAGREFNENKSNSPGGVIK